MGEHGPVAPEVATIHAMSEPTPDPATETSDATDELKRTPLEAEHRRLGAKLAPFAGWLMPIEYEGALAEHRVVRTSVGLFDLTHLGKVEVVGPGALGMLQRVVTNDLSTAAVGDALQPRPERGRRGDRGPDRLPARRASGTSSFRTRPTRRGSCGCSRRRRPTTACT